MSRTGGEPAFVDAFFLFEEFKDAPERGETYDTDTGTEQAVGNEECSCNAAQSDEKEYPPETYAGIIFSFDHDGVENTDNKEGAQSDGKS